MSNLTAFAGDTLTIDIDLVDGITGSAIASATVSKIWVSVGSTVYTEASAEVTKLATSIRVTVPASSTVSLRSAQPISAKVQTTSGNISTIADSSITFKSTNLSTQL